jgi:hypothetical protein
LNTETPVLASSREPDNRYLVLCDQKGLTMALKGEPNVASLEEVIGEFFEEGASIRINATRRQVIEPLPGTMTNRDDWEWFISELGFLYGVELPKTYTPPWLTKDD